MDQDQKRRYRPETRAAEVDESHWRRRSSAKYKSRKASILTGQENLPNRSLTALSPNKEETPLRSVSRFESVPNETADSIAYHRKSPEDDVVESEASDSVPRLGINGHVSSSPNVQGRKGSVTERVMRHHDVDEHDAVSDNAVTERQEGVSERSSRQEEEAHVVRKSQNFASGRNSLVADGQSFHEAGGGRDIYSPESNRLLNSTSVSVGKNIRVPFHNSRQRRERHFTGNGALSNGTSYFHGDIVDDNLMISNSKLDNALLKMFSPQPSRSLTSSHSLAAPSSLIHDQSDDISMAPVMWRVHPMEAVHRETLDRETGFLADHLAPRDMIGDLFRRNVLTSADYNQLSRMEGQGDRAVTRLMIKTLQRRGHTAYPAFLDSLRQHGYHNVCERLLESDRSLKNGIQQDRSSYDRVKDWVNHERSLPNGLRTSFSFHQRYSPLSTDYSLYPMYHTMPLMSPPSHMTPGYNLPLAYHMPLSLPMTPPTYPLVTNQSGGFSSRVTPPPREPIVFNQLETQLDFMRKELKALHYDVHDMKSALRHNGQGSTPSRIKRPKEGNRTVDKHDNKPDPGSRPHSPPSADSSNRSPTPVSPSPVQRLDGTPRPDEGEKSYKIIEAEGLNKHLGELHAEVKALHDDVTALTTARSRKGQSVTPTRQHVTYTDQDSHARKLEEQLEELHAQLRRLRHDVTDLKTVDNQHSFKTTPETKGILKPTKSAASPQYLSPDPHPNPAHQGRPVTKQEPRDNDRRKSSNFLDPGSSESQASMRKSSNDSFRAPSSNGPRITTESRVLSPPPDREARIRRITSPLTVLPDQSLPWPESTRVKVAT